MTSRGKVTTAGHKGQGEGAMILGKHPVPPQIFGEVLEAKDGETHTKVPHRALTEKRGKRAHMVKGMRGMIIRHHTTPAALERSKQHSEAMKRLGFGTEQSKLRLFPTNPTTRKGNLAEVVLAEYVVAACGLSLPVYRLRYNPNVNQSMKGDDVLAFDLDSNPVRLIVGEAKFRGASSGAAVEEVIDALVRSYKAGVPVSLQFVAERLFEAGQGDLGARILDCAKQFALGKLRIDYVGMLLSDTKSSERVENSTPDSLRRLAMISFGVDEPERLAGLCYANLK